jgi:hypothetical protein
MSKNDCELGCAPVGQFKGPVGPSGRQTQGRKNFKPVSGSLETPCWELRSTSMASL